MSDEKQITIPSIEELELINDYIKEQDFYKNDTSDSVIDLFLVLVGYGLKPEKALRNVRSIVSAIKNEYGE